MDTIFALSSGRPPAGIAVIRVSGANAGTALQCLAGSLPPPRKAVVRHLQAADGLILDQAMVLWLPGPHTVTGEDIAELHLHGGRAVVAGVESALAALHGLRPAVAGEFTRRAFLNGRIDLAQAEGLADLLAAETEIQRRCAMTMAEGEFSTLVSHWQEELLLLSASIEAVLDFSDEDDVAALPASFGDRLADLSVDLEGRLKKPGAEKLKDGFRVVLSGPPNVGKSTLFNALVGEEAAITSPLAGTTRDVLSASVALEGIPFQFIDTAGLHAVPRDVVEEIGIARAQKVVGDADVVLWLGEEGQGPSESWEVAARADCDDFVAKPSARHTVSAQSGLGVDYLRQDLVAHARQVLPKPGDAALSAWQKQCLRDASDMLCAAKTEDDPLLIAERLRLARAAFDRLTGRAGTEDMLDALFGRFCIGK
ncbi:MAG: tRNA uridine-5-carboxymethylaminomethyl(34) synthesis GTPase MnmE [Novosphingobium sp.]